MMKRIQKSSLSSQFYKNILQPTKPQHQNPNYFSRSLSSSFKGNIRMPKNPTKATTSWERGAKLTKQTQTTNQYLEHIRDIHDPTLHLKTIEDELKGTMGKALGKQGQKILGLLGKMQDLMECHHELLLLVHNEDIDNNDETQQHDDEKQSKQQQQLEKLPEQTQQKLQRIINQYNQYRKDAIHARWELIVHRQAVGFIVDNHKYVRERYPIPPPLPNLVGVDVDDNDEYSGGKKIDVPEPVTRNFGDQLDWWNNILRR